MKGDRHNGHTGTIIIQIRIEAVGVANAGGAGNDVIALTHLHLSRDGQSCGRITGQIADQPRAAAKVMTLAGFIPHKN